MVFSSSQHVVICVLYQGQGTIKVCPGCAGHTGHTETQLVPRGSQECDDVFYPAALPLTVGARWNARALEPMPHQSRPISKIMTAAAKPHVLPTISGVAGALAAETL